MSSNQDQSAALLDFSESTTSQPAGAPNPFQMRMMQRQKEREMKQTQKPKETKSKEELAQLRKEMMKVKTVKNTNSENLLDDQAAKKKDPPH